MKDNKQSEFNYYKYSNKNERDEMIKSIDKKIEQLSIEEKKNSNDTNKKNEFLAFEDKKKGLSLNNTNVDIKEVFSAFIGGYSGPSSYYYVNKIGKKYQFCYGYSEDGHCIFNKQNNSEMNYEERDEVLYESFTKELTTKMLSWKKSYDNNDIIDGTQWEICFKEDNLTYYGSNAYPPNFKEVRMLFLKYFTI